MKRLLLPTDFSACAEKALQYAVTIAQQAGAELILVHACDLLVNRFEDRKAIIAEYNLTTTTALNSKLVALKNRIEDQDKVPVTIKLYDGDITDSILEAADKYKPDLIVMGTTGASGIKKLLLGSHAADVISKSSIPVLTVPAHYEGFALKEMLLAINNPEEKSEKLKVFFELARLFKAHVRLMVVTYNREDAATYIEDHRHITYIQGKLQNQYGEQNLAVEHLSGTNFQDTVQDFIDKNNIDIIGMITRKREALQRYFNKSATKAWAYQTTIPLLSLPQ